MWVFTTHGSLCIERDPWRPGELRVGGQSRALLEDLFPDHEILESPEGDHALSVPVAPAEFGQLLATRVACIDYDDFKTAVPPGPYKETLYGVWFAGFLQNRGEVAPDAEA